MVSFSGFKKWLSSRKLEAELSSLAVGMNSSVDFVDDCHIVMLDYDVKDVQKVIESVWELQDFWNLSDADVFRTKNGFHVFFWFDHVPYDRLRMIVSFARFVDPMYKYISRYYSHKTIRVSGKYAHRDIWFVQTVEGVRDPEDSEFQVGRMKKAEHAHFVRSQ
jgi:hypothetical protein